MLESKPAPRILVADDERLMNDFVKEILRRRGFAVDQALDGGSAIAMLKGHTYDMVIADKKMPRSDGIDVLKATLSTQPKAKFIMMTAYGTVEGAVEAMRLGAFDYIMKPFDASQIEEVVHRALSRGTDGQPGKSRPTKLIGNSEKIREVLELIEVVAPTRSTVLITGDTGTGKELVAREIQRLSGRSDKPFVRLNCAALPDGLIESELFGHERGAFTGALRKRMGKFELADGGTILLDEIGEIGIGTQAKVLRVLQEQEFDRIGSHQTQRVDVRVITTTNKNPLDEMRAGRFREDLYYRLSVFPIHLPPLRERPEDIPLLVDHFLKIYGALSKKRIDGVTDEVLEIMTSHSWPGNVRELENCMERALIVTSGRLITRQDIIPPASPSRSIMDNLDPGTSLREMEKILILKTLEAVGWNRTAAAEKLGISTRTLRNKLKIYEQEEISLDAESLSAPTGSERQLVCTP
jgi:two-component system response regulator HydG